MIHKPTRRELFKYGFAAFAAAFGARKAYGALPASDDFNRASLGSNWTTTNGSLTWSIISSVEIDPDWGGGGGVAAMYWNADTFGNDQISTIIIGTTPVAGSYVGPAVRISTVADTFYTFLVTGNASVGTAYLCRDPSFTVIEGPLDISSLLEGDEISLEITGTTLTAKKNGSTVHSEADATYSSGQAGVASGGGDTHITEWTGDNLGGAPAAVRRRIITL